MYSVLMKQYIEMFLKQSVLRYLPKPSGLYYKHLYIFQN